MRIGYYDDDGYTKPIPAVQRAVRMSKEALKRAGHELVPFKVPRINDAIDIINGGLFDIVFWSKTYVVFYKVAGGVFLINSQRHLKNRNFKW